MTFHALAWEAPPAGAPRSLKICKSKKFQVFHCCATDRKQQIGSDDGGLWLHGNSLQVWLNDKDSGDACKSLKTEKKVAKSKEQECTNKITLSSDS